MEIKMKIAEIPINEVTPYVNNPREIESNVVTAIAKSIQKYGFRQPLVVDQDGTVIVGHGRLLAARKLGMKTVPAEVVDMNTDEARAYRIDDNRIGEMAKWDVPKLVDEIDDLPEDFLIGWDQSEIEDIIASMLDDEDFAAGDNAREYDYEERANDSESTAGVIDAPFEEDTDPTGVAMVTLKIRIPKKHAAPVRDLIESTIERYMEEYGDE